MGKQQLLLVGFFSFLKNRPQAADDVNIVEDVRFAEVVGEP